MWPLVGHQDHLIQWLLSWESRRSNSRKQSDLVSTRDTHSHAHANHDTKKQTVQTCVLYVFLPISDYLSLICLGT